jgi:hypothetical protein
MGMIVRDPINIDHTDLIALLPVDPGCPVCAVSTSGLLPEQRKLDSLRYLCRGILRRSKPLTRKVGEQSQCRARDD